jgi:hypothetical protein
MKLDKWLDKRDQKPTKLQEAHITQLRVLDSLCTKCLKGEPMLCGGVRAYFIEDESDLYGYPRIASKSCSKLQTKMSGGRLANKLKDSYVPPSFAADYLREKPDRTLLDLSERPAQLYSRASDDNTRTIWKDAVELIYSGYSAIYMYPPWINKRYKGKYQNDYKDKLPELVDDVLENFDYVIVERLDFGVGQDLILDTLTLIVEQRIAMGLPLLVTLGDNPQGRNNTEKRLYAQIQKWTTLEDYPIA